MKTVNTLQPRDTARLLRVALMLNKLADNLEATLGEAPAKRRRRRSKKAKAAKTTAKAEKKSKKYPVNAPPADATAT